MKPYILAIITVSIIGGIISSLLSNNSSLKKYVNFISGLICAITLLAPIASVVNNASAFTNGIDNFMNKIDVNQNIDERNNIIIDESVDKICEGIKNAIVTSFKLNEAHVSVSLKINSENLDSILLEEVLVTLTESATWYDDNKIKEYVQELVGCKVLVIKK